MKRLVLGWCMLAFILTACNDEQGETQTAKADFSSQEKAEYAIVIHGGAGTIKRENMTVEREAEYRAIMNKALDIGEEILKNGGTSLEAVEKTIMTMEDSPLFNAGKGAVFTHEGRNELDASVMNGADRNAGAVGGVTIVKSPIQAAIAVMNESPHVMLTGEGAEQFALKQGVNHRVVVGGGGLSVHPLVLFSPL